MKYIITEERLGKLVLKFLEQIDFIDDAQIEDGKVIIYLKRPFRIDDVKDLAGQIKSMFDYHGEIYMNKSSRTRWNMILYF
jgi:hypothetical protein